MAGHHTRAAAAMFANGTMGQQHEPDTTCAQRTLACGLAVYPVGIGCWAIGGPATNLGLPMGWSTADQAASLSGLETACQRARTCSTPPTCTATATPNASSATWCPGPRDSLVISSKVGYFAGTAAHPYLPGHAPPAGKPPWKTSAPTTWTSTSCTIPTSAKMTNTSTALSRRCAHSKTQGLIKAVGMRGPHRFATDRLTVPRQQREDKYARFRHLFTRVRPGLPGCPVQRAHPAPATRPTTSSPSPPRTGRAC